MVKINEQHPVRRKLNPEIICSMSVLEPIYLTSICRNRIYIAELSYNFTFGLKKHLKEERVKAM